MFVGGIFYNSQTGIKDQEQIYLKKMERLHRKCQLY